VPVISSSLGFYEPAHRSHSLPLTAHLSMINKDNYLRHRKES